MALAGNALAMVVSSAELDSVVTTRSAMFHPRTALRFSSPFRTVVEELLNGITRCPFRSNPRSLLSSSQGGQDHTVKISRAFSFKLCLNFESLICLSNSSLISDKLFKNRLDG